MKKTAFKQKIAALAAMVMIFGTLPISAAGVDTKEGEIFAYQFSPNDMGLEHIHAPYKIKYDDLQDQGVKVMARTTKAILDTMPVGQRCIDLNLVTRYIAEDSENWLWWDTGAARVEKLIDEFFSELKANGAQIDYIIDDCEIGMSNWLFNHNADRLPQIVGDPRYETEIRPLLAEAGFTFSDYGETELQYLVDYSRSNAYNIWNGVMSRRVAGYYNKAVTEPINKYYPSVKNSNYGMVASVGEEKVLYDTAGHRVYQCGKLYAGGTHSAPILYSRLGALCSSGRGPEGYPYDVFQNNSFNAMVYAMVHASDAVVSTEGGNFMPWIPLKSWTSSKYSNSKYYDEVMFHLGLMGADPFLVFNVGAAEDEVYLNNILKELNTVVGNGKRKTLVTDQYKWDQRYALTGMELADKNIWRITPDLYTPGITMENFLMDSKNMIFQIGNQVVDFPEGSAILKVDSTSDYGYWITTPKGTKPTELRVEGIEIPAAPVMDENSQPIGYTVNKTYKKYDPNAPATTPDEGEDKEETQATTPKPDTSSISGHWAARALNKAVADGLIVGSDKGLEPDRNVTKAELITMMMRANGIENDQSQGPQWYSAAANKAVELGWTGYLGDIEYDINRAASAGIIANAMKITDVSLEGKTFTDDAQINTTGYLNAVKGCVSLGIITGYPDGSFKPQNTITRAEAVVIIQRAFY